ncbi:MAG: PHP domain-containing protein [Deltaproteobacteria bacterium]|nr:PHP domain-containing protein [Deltaproteobacteria bacterium]
MIDLHIHTTASDGTLSPGQVVTEAAKAGLGAIAITDHDTLDGVEEACRAVRSNGVPVLPGLEISVEFRGPNLEPGKPGWMHLLVYWPGLLVYPGDGEKSVDAKIRALNEKETARTMNELKQWRLGRNQKIIDKLNNLGIKISLDEVVAKSGGGQVGRPHFASVLVNKGYVRNRQEAFDNYLAKGGAAYVDKKRLSLEQALDLALSEHAVPVLAHPVSLGLGDDDLRAGLASWKRAGLKGLEAMYPEHTMDYTMRLLGMARALELVATGGSDFHGQNKPAIMLGSGRNHNLAVPENVLKDLEDCV